MLRTKKKDIEKKKWVELHDLLSNIHLSNICVIGAQTTNGVKNIFEEMMIEYSKFNEWCTFTGAKCSANKKQDKRKIHLIAK